MSFFKFGKKKPTWSWNQDEEEDDSLLQSVQEAQKELCGSIKLSRKERLYGFAICFAAGFTMSALGVILLGLGNLTFFAVLYSLGTVSSIASSLFLFGPMHHVKNMFKETRVIATVLMFVFIALTLVAALKWKNALLAIIFCFCQFLACTWYCLSYIPFARRIVASCATKCIDV